MVTTGSICSPDDSRKDSPQVSKSNSTPEETVPPRSPVPEEPRDTHANPVEIPWTEPGPSVLNKPNPLLDAALAYAARGWPVVPNHGSVDGRCTCGRGPECRTPGKHPRTEHGYKDATTDPAAIQEWWARDLTANVGVATGRASGLLVIDIDAKNGGFTTLEELQAELGTLPPTVKCLTGGGGQHLYFKRPPINGDIISAPHGLGRGVDVRVDGAMVVAPPSLHATGKRYEWAPGQAPGEIALAELPPAFVERLPTRSSSKTRDRGEDRAATSKAPIASALTPDDQRLLYAAQSAKNGDRFNALWRGDRCDLPSNSERDLALCQMLAFWTRKNAEQMDRMFRRSGCLRDKWDEVHHGDGRTYGEGTIAKAIEGCRNVYMGDPDSGRNDGRDKQMTPQAVEPGRRPLSQKPDGPSADLDYETVLHAARAGADREQCWRIVHGGGGFVGGDREYFDGIWLAVAAETAYRLGGHKPTDFPRTDLGNAERLVAIFGKLIRYVWRWKKWLAWDGRRWREDDTGEIMRHARRTARSIYDDAKRETDPARKKALAKFAAASESQRSLQAMVKLAQGDAGVAIRPEVLDTDPWLLNCENGTLDLRTGQLRQQHQRDMITKMIPVEYDPNAKCERWRQFFDEIFAAVADLVRFVQQFVGMSLTGDVREQTLAIFNGKGSNGKSVLIDTVLGVLGEYAAIAAPDLLVASGMDRHPTEIADLAGRRLVVSSETDEGRRMRVEFIKQATGDRILKARRMGEDFWQFQRQFKMVLVTNNLPRVREESHAIWRRIKVVPFNVTIPDDEEDKTLVDTLRGEWPGILAWAVRGCLDWQANGLIYPAAVRDASLAYRQQEDLIEQFIEDCCVMGSSPMCAVTRRAIRKAYSIWAREVDERATLSRNSFYKRLRDRPGVREFRTANVRGFVGIGLARPADFLEHGEQKAEAEFIDSVARAQTPSLPQVIQQIADTLGGAAAVPGGGQTLPTGAPASAEVLSERENGVGE